MSANTDTLKRLFKAIELVRMLDEQLPVQTLAALLVVGIEEGKTITEIGAKTGLAQSSASRNLSVLGDLRYDKKPGALKLVEYRQNMTNLSLKEVHLTAKGKALLDNIVNLLNTGGK